MSKLLIFTTFTYQFFEQKYTNFSIKAIYAKIAYLCFQNDASSR